MAAATLGHSALKRFVKYVMWFVTRACKEPPSFAPVALNHGLSCNTRGYASEASTTPLSAAISNTKLPLTIERRREHNSWQTKNDELRTIHNGLEMFYGTVLV